MHTEFWWGNVRDEDREEDGRIILRLILGNLDGGMDWIDVA
jgi:hypothetical protein